jgi:hypothetical protein
MPTFANSAAFQPTPSPATTRPSLSASSVASCLATTTGLRMGMTITLVPEAGSWVLRADPREGQDRVVDPAVVLTGVVGDEHVIGGPDGRPAEPLGDLGRGLDALGRGTVGKLGRRKSVVHRRLIIAIRAERCW